MFARDECVGFLHLIVHTRFGVEFQQPAITVEGLAQACVHDKRTKSFFSVVGEAINKKREECDRKAIVQLLEEVKSDEELSNVAHW